MGKTAHKTDLNGKLFTYVHCGFFMVSIVLNEQIQYSFIPFYTRELMN